VVGHTHPVIRLGDPDLRLTSEGKLTNATENVVGDQGAERPETPAPRFWLLGELAVTAGPARVHISGARQRAILATLLLNNNHVVSTAALIEAIWARNLPRTATDQIYICISSLRKQLGGPGQRMIETRAGGYVLHADEDATDVRRFEKLTAHGADLAHAGRPAEAVDVLRSALALWRGPALFGIDSRSLQISANRLDDLRLSTLEDCVDLELRLGRYKQAVAQLGAVVDEHPLNERLCALYVVALHRCGRRAEALAVYRRARSAIREELGLEPGYDLRAAHAAILADEPLAAGDRPSVPVARSAEGRLPVPAAND
jgi:DNA-binding SARP family transcriptional activator